MSGIVDNFARLIGAAPGVSGLRVTCFIADRDKAKQLVDESNLRRHLNAVLETMYQLGNGATAWYTSGFYTATGRSADAMREKTYVMFCYVRADVDVEQLVHVLRGVLHRYGRECRQEEVVVNCSGEDSNGKYANRSYFIGEYDPPLNT